ncbi:MAG TPA: MBL fold metallo-hydrolase [Kofleriaceae bacterium]|nr:MBL fold metallo-hydrolase [Kofleriaceae bacterium]
MLDVGQGDSTLIVLPDDRAVIFDCADDHVLRKALDDWNIKVIEAFVLSHLDWDHVAGALDFLLGFGGEIRDVYLPRDRDVSDSHESAKRAKELLDYAAAQSRDEGARRRRWELHYNFRDSRPIAHGTGWAITLLAPAVAQYVQQARDASWEEPNRYSSILRVEAGGNAMLVGGDAPLLSWSQLPPEELPAKVFRIPHHGGAINDGGVPPKWDVDRLYREVGVETALISVGTNNAHGHPRPEWIAPVTGGKCRLLCTQVTGRCHGPLETIQADGRIVRDADQIATQRQRVVWYHQQWTLPQYRHLTDDLRAAKADQLEVPCAGTVIVTLYSDGRLEVLPLPRGRYEEVIDRWRHPLCRATSPGA